MSVKLRFTRLGRKRRPFYRLNAIDSRVRRDGRSIEELGYYDPITRDKENAVKLNRERIEYWLSRGAQTSPTVATLLKKHGIGKPESTN
jgi:small subunit ribosomal protein S16